MVNLSKLEQTTVDTYNKIAPRWVVKQSLEMQWTEAMEKFHELLPSGRILEIGAGGGRDARGLIELGYQYVGTDPSSRLLNVARRNNPGVTFEKTSVYDLNYQDPFDGFWCAAVLLHIPRNRLDEALSQIRLNMRPGATGFISIKEGRGEEIRYEDKQKLRGARLFVYWKDNDFKKSLQHNGYTVLNLQRYQFKKGVNWLAYHVQVSGMSL